MNYNFRKSTAISVNRNAQTQKIKIEITTELDCRKSTLHVNEKRVAEEIENFWDKAKRKCSKLLSVHSYFSQIDYYDNEVDVYETPIFKLERGKRKAEIGHQTHGEIPKDWEQNLIGVFGETKVMGQYCKFIEEVVGSSKYNEWKAKGLEKSLRKVLQGKEQGFCIENYGDDD